MDVLKNNCWFKSEQTAPTSTHVSLPDLEAYVRRGRATTSAVALSDGRQVVSVSVKDASQGDVASLPCGARSLLIEAETGAIVCRGINKFFDLSEVGDQWLSDASLWEEEASYRVWAVRKMAGFVVTIFSLDGVHLDVMSKHVLAGPHVDAARALLAKLSALHRSQMASDLFAWDACASFECIRRADDHQHPVLEVELFDQQLVLIAVQRRAQLQEESVGLAALSSLAEKWGVRAASASALRDGVALQETLRSVGTWRCVYPPFTECPLLAEGFVLLIEAFPKLAHEGSLASLPWCLPLRLKLKTPRYVVLRAFRSLVMGDSKPQSFLYHQALLAWLGPAMSTEQIRVKLVDVGVSQLCDEFESALSAKCRLRHRDAAETVGQALAQLHEITARAATPRGHCPLTVLVLCGLPGAGKTTVAKTLVKILSANAASSLRFVVHVSRDMVSRDVAQMHEINENSSKHKQRRLRALVHDTLCNELRDVARFCLESQQRGLLILDACNATEASRQVWRRCLPVSLDSYQIVHVDCPDTTISAQRAGNRVNHEVLRNAAEAQHALYTVRRKFQPPTEKESCWYVDTNAQTAEGAALILQQRLAQQQQDTELLGGGAGTLRVLSVAAVRAEMQQSHAALLRCLLGLSEETAAQFADVASFLAVEKRTTKRRSLQIRLYCSTEALRDTVADILSPSIGVASGTEALGSLASAGRRLARKVASFLWANSSAPFAAPAGVCGHVVRGHLRWLRGWLLHGKDAAAPSDVAMALRERFESEVSTPHVTLLHSGAASPSLTEEDIHSFLSTAGLRVGEEVVVRVPRLLLDRHALCFSAVLSSGQAVQGGASSSGKDAPVPLHVTVATAAGTSSAYAGGMFALFEKWQRENDALASRQQAPQQQVNRSQCKYHNFAEFELNTAVELRGVVEVTLQ